MTRNLSVFLDLPAPWDAVEHAKIALRVCSSRFFFTCLATVFQYLIDPFCDYRKTAQHGYAVLVLAWNKFLGP